ncbi:tRNA (N6-isopentenyl adenosine(37)-C2)-methylthiotransferase MiaB [Prosthecochloris sp. HL-130-GSB]|jgi:tRNA-2-methylthio-N6-dimethylallyladenosine synthase|uniref:tRNA-2-methylthio-N(6)-dimethylallyladenosine synthase n=1 Tax=Prosthecochloris aestuarii TaxID=1102 RepID=A0A831WSR4_PROAE|nr:tRNA (N6-isopentenyl adenosine(37)-C2)-methylthiotransferase MiaB [Prosthecochloris sp. HL-130-GSB]ARM31564.1 tRNA (N6-isopentenyl adenosine(37)-C2)-methylthiotransferase MiaB [Prosthecochloris sp. HL-130-GSB]MBO8093002.1 tRNA (N6-isopentenyl adenosine(37)-C2)-methylthiotransferase MiaB [Prosthecochloris sp.]HED31795.1 tRNA (N6-isopentenyl adenosine(37)-C2)-methylthiotransferase MiaB [Prosthecochloris aestuarii]
MSTTFFIRTFGCQMNQADSEIISALLEQVGYRQVETETDAGLVLLNTCAVRENAVQKIMHHLDGLKGLKRKRPDLLVGVIGCVPQYYRQDLFSLSGAIDFIAGPDTYRRLPSLVEDARKGMRAADLSFLPDETYAGIMPARSNPVSAFIPVMRGCNNMCAFCVVPFTRGRERSRSLSSIIGEVERLGEQGYREITLLGQNVNSYLEPDSGDDFAVLLDRVSRAVPDIRVRFTTSHPKDISRSLVEVIAERDNVCNSLHLPVQSGSSRMLEIMQRGHTREEYLETISMVRGLVPGIALSTDLIAGFCTETSDDHLQTLSLLEEVRFDYAYTFYYSVRPGTYAANRLDDTVSLEEKKRRLAEIVELQNRISGELFRAETGNIVEVLAEGESRRSSLKLMGRTGTNRVVVFDRRDHHPGDLVNVLVESATSATLTGYPV